MSITQAEHLSIAVIGDEDLVSGLRLAGISKYYMIKDDHSTHEDIRNALSELTAKSEVGVVVILEDYAEHARDMLSRIREEKRAFPVIIEVPSKFGTKYKDIVGFYKAFIKDSIGFDIEI